MSGPTHFVTTCWLCLFLSGLPLPASADPLALVDARLRQLEQILANVGSETPAETAVKPKPPELQLAKPEHAICDRDGEDLRAEQSDLAERLATKRETVDALDERVTALRGTLMKNGCTDNDRKHIQAMKAEINVIDFGEEKRLADALLDCTNNKILQGETRKDALLASKSDALAVVGMNKTLDRLNRFSREVLDLSIDIGSAADLLDRLRRSIGKFDTMCSVDTF